MCRCDPFGSIVFRMTFRNSCNPLLFIKINKNRIICKAICRERRTMGCLPQYGHDSIVRGEGGRGSEGKRRKRGKSTQKRRKKRIEQEARSLYKRWSSSVSVKYVCRAEDPRRAASRNLRRSSRSFTDAHGYPAERGVRSIVVHGHHSALTLPNGMLQILHGSTRGTVCRGQGRTTSLAQRRN